MDDKVIFSLDCFTGHVKRMRLALIQILRFCLDKLYEDCSMASYEEAKHLWHISTLVNRVNPEVKEHKKKEKKRKKALEEKDDLEKSQEIKKNEKKD